MAHILYLGDSSPSSTSGHRAMAMKRRGHSVTVLDAFQVFKKQLHSPWLGPIHYHTGFRLIDSTIVSWLKKYVAGSPPKPDIVWINSAELYSPRSLKVLKSFSCPIILYINDDPTGGRDGNRFNLLLKSIPHYDICVAVREVNAVEFKSKGAKQVVRVYMSYDELSHRPCDISEVPDALRSEVAFIGTWMRNEKRDELILELISRGVPVSIWGNRWDKSPYFSELKSHWRGGAVTGRDYAAAIRGAKISLGLLSKGNRDMHTTRSLEIPFAGGLFCGERTPEHLQLYKEGIEAVFWSTPEECAEVCLQLLKDENKRENIRIAGTKKLLALKMGNEDVVSTILGFALEKRINISPFVKVF